MKLQQQAQMQGAYVQDSSEFILELLARQNFEARNTRRDRAWSKDQVGCEPRALVLSERERAEFIEQARFELESRRGS
jgi:hypothetical protein